MAVPYSIDSRVKMLFQRRLINPSPFPATARFNWMGAPPYRDPNWYPGISASAMVKQGVNPTWRKFTKPTNPRVVPLTRGGSYPSIGVNTSFSSIKPLNGEEVHKAPETQLA